MITLIICIACTFAALVCYASVYVASKADRISEKYWEEHENELHGQSDYREGYRNK